MARSTGSRVALPLRPQVAGKVQPKGSGVVVLRLVPDAAQARDEGDLKIGTLREHAKARRLERLQSVLARFEGLDGQRLIRSVPPAELVALERRAARSALPPLRSLTAYWRLTPGGATAGRVGELLAALREVPEVEAAWEQEDVTPPLVTPGDDPHNAGQTYQDAAPTGIDARWMWLQADGEGAGVGVIDVEGGWRETHEDLAGKAPTLIHGSENPSWVDHGTAVLGEIVASDNTAGVVGCAPAVTNVRMASIFDAGLSANTADALVAAAVAASPGDIVLIEVQIGFKPVETVDDCLDAIRLAVALGVIVVEAAGNGDTDLDAWVGTGGRTLDRADANFVESGAIMVGAAESALPHDRWAYSNYGSRIDCYAYGENVTTTGYGDLDDGGGDLDKEYTDTFKGTSSASPIIVGAAALVQSRYKAVAGTVLSPLQMRAILSDPATGTAQGGGVAGFIGVMPDLALVVPGLGLVADLYMRDAIGDTGVVPWGGSISSSPDVIVLPAPVADPQAAFGEGSGTENSATLGHQVEAGQDNVIHVRVRNRGGTAATNVRATVFWSPASTLVTPSMWTLIGSVTLPNVPVGDVLTVSPALTWPKAAIPATGHYCFVAVLDHAQDAAPPTPDSLIDWANFTAYIRNHNNVTWRNFNVVDVLPDAPSGTATFPFLVAGAEDRSLRFGFELERRLPRDARVELEGPYWLLKALRGAHAWKLGRADKEGLARLLLPALPQVRFGDVALPGRARCACRLVVRSGKQRIAWGHGVALRQLVGRDEVGRIGWQFARPVQPCGEQVERIRR